jgi:50S ribosomal protein L16 3-hydroxylase
MAVVRDWLGDLPFHRFVASHLQREPLARVATARPTAARYGWNALQRVLAGQPEQWVVARGELVERPSPCSRSQLRALFREGMGIVVKHPERHDAAFAELSASFACDVPGEQRVLVFATPRHTHGFAWHYDAEDVFIVQVAGEKEYFFRHNTIDPRPRRGAQPDFGTIRHERTPLLACRLHTGDVLYLPRGMWHVGYAHQDALSISIGVYPDQVR